MSEDGGLADALRRVEENANQEWIELAKVAVQFCAQQYDEFTTDEVWKVLDHYPDVTTHEPRAMSAPINWAVRQGIIVRSICGHCGSAPIRKSERPEQHRNPIPIYKPGPNAR